jgi:hypothetical protein
VTREFDYLLAAVRRFFNPDASLVPRDGLDWGRVKSLAERHAVVPVLHAAVGNGDEHLDRRVREIVRFDLRLSAELVKLLGALDRARIEAISLKGPVLGSLLYGDRVLRTSDDLDLVVRRGDAVRVRSVFEGLGYRMESVPHWPGGATLLRARDSQMSFSDPTETVSVDVHWTFFPEYFPSPFDERDVWNNLRRTHWCGSTVRTLAPEDLVLFLCAHSAKHCWRRLSWLCDIARLLQLTPDLDWQAVFDRTRRTSTSRLIATSLLLVRSVLRLELPDRAWQWVQAQDVSTHRLAAAVAQDGLAGGSRPSSVASALMCLRMLESTSHRRRFLFGTVFQPSEAEFMSLQLPPALYWLYYPFRPLRLAAKHARKAIARRRGSSTVPLPVSRALRPQ